MAGDAFEKMKSSLNRGMTAISQKTSSSLEKVKIKSNIDSLNAEIEKMMNAVGKAAYAVWESGSSDYDSMAGLFSAVKQKKDEVVSLQSEYDSIDEKNSQIPEQPAAEENTASENRAEGIVCPNCGTQSPVFARFCKKCGHRLQEEA